MVPMGVWPVGWIVNGSELVILFLGTVFLGIAAYLSPVGGRTTGCLDFLRRFFARQGTGFMSDALKARILGPLAQCIGGT